MCKVKIQVSPSVPLGTIWAISEPIHISTREEFYICNNLFKLIAYGVKTLDMTCHHMPLGTNQMQQIFAVAQEVLDESY